MRNREGGRWRGFAWNRSGRRKWGMAGDGGSSAIECGGEEAEIHGKGVKQRGRSQWGTGGELGEDGGGMRVVGMAAATRGRRQLESGGGGTRAAEAAAQGRRQRRHYGGGGTMVSSWSEQGVAAAAAAQRRAAAAAVAVVGLLPRPSLSSHLRGRALLSFFK